MADYSPTRIPDSVKERFWSKVDKRGPDECWPWTAGRMSTGYGAFAHKRQQFAASRFALVLTTGFIPDRHLHACHSCDNPPCCNPAHLRWGTVSDNAQDAIERGRRKFGHVKTHCKRGHPYTPDSVYRKANGGNGGCKICDALRGAVQREISRRRRGVKGKRKPVWSDLTAPCFDPFKDELELALHGDLLSNCQAAA